MRSKSSGLLVCVLVTVVLATAVIALDCTLPENDSQVFPNPANCSTYFICSRENAVLMECPPGLIWNSNVSACDFPFNWECKDQSSVVRQIKEDMTFVQPEKQPHISQSMSSEEDDYEVDNDVECAEEIDVTLLPSCAPDANYTAFPNPYNCSQFYECDNGEAKVHDCPPGLHFNVVEGVCDFVWSANCTELPMPPNCTEEVLVESSKDESIFVEPNCPPPGSGGDIPHFPNPDNCTTYWICDNGRAILIACPNGLVYNPAIENCDFSWALNCTGICCPNKETHVLVDEQLSVEFKDAYLFVVPDCPPPGGGGEPPRFPNEENCTTYWICDNGKAKLQSCPDGLVFNPAVQACDFPWALNCTGICCPNHDAPANEDSSINDDQVLTFAVPHCPPPGGGGDIPHFPNEENCTTYWICDNGLATLLSCPVGLVYNPPIEACDFPWALNCTGICCPNKAVKYLVPADLSLFDAPNCPPPGGTGEIPRFPNADNCTTFWICDNGVAKLLSCPVGLVYNPAIQNCDFAWALNCTGICCPNKIAPRARFICPKDPFDVVHLPNPDDCSTFYKCDINEVPVLVSCPAGLEFNPTIKVCDYPENAQCSVSIAYLRRQLL